MIPTLKPRANLSSSARLACSAFSCAICFSKFLICAWVLCCSLVLCLAKTMEPMPLLDLSSAFVTIANHLQFLFYFSLNIFFDDLRVFPNTPNPIPIWVTDFNPLGKLLMLPTCLIASLPSTVTIKVLNSPFNTIIKPSYA